MSVSYLSENRENKLAYVHFAATKSGAHLPAVMFLGGFKSDMEGTKAIYLEAQCRARGQEFVRFDYSGHGVSEGEFVDGTIGQWRADAAAILDHIVQSDDVILVGSSMGGWISLLLLLSYAKRVKGVVGIAAAPDFTKDIEVQLTDAQRQAIEENGRLEEPNDYSDEPYIFTKALIDDGRDNSLLHKTYEAGVPMILLQGKQDADVPWHKALRIQECFGASYVDVTFIDDGDHRLSRDQDLSLIDQAVRRLSE